MAIYRKSTRSKPRYFSNDLKALLYAFGDSSSPNAETIQALEDVLTSYLIDVVMEANKVRTIQKRNKLKVEDVMFALRRDPVKLGRVYDLQEMDRKITMAKKMFDEEAEKPSEKEADEGVKKRRRKNK
ncbi:DEKNAAC105346 [Brettanomyces naardenensis]|uniref:Transcription initiation factor TFIID subunit 13 n=1 Tax=Brettanomyces naardenensis TaxID=13370 RepID=A0A448YTE6_BRENA|nr:DEKNAAC105346 [Brettanomyces naardenensis]